MDSHRLVKEMKKTCASVLMKDACLVHFICQTVSAYSYAFRQVLKRDELTITSNNKAFNSPLTHEYTIALIWKRVKIDEKVEFATVCEF